MPAVCKLWLRWNFGLVHAAPHADHVDGDAELGGESGGVGSVGLLGQGVLDGGDEHARGEAVGPLLVAAVVAGGVAVVGVAELVRERAQGFGVIHAEAHGDRALLR